MDDGPYAPHGHLQPGEATGPLTRPRQLLPEWTDCGKNRGLVFTEQMSSPHHNREYTLPAGLHTAN